MESNQIILPNETIQIETENLKIAPQFTVDNVKKAIVANQMGTLISARKKKYTFVGIKTSPCKYFPEKEDHIIGVITAKNMEYYTLNIGGPNDATLGVIDFEGASKRNRPYLDVGCLVYARVATVNRFMKAQVTCISTSTKKDWASGESIFGELNTGMMIDIPLSYSRDLLIDSKGLLKALQKYITFEIAIGHNGKVWALANSIKNTMLILNVIKKAVDMDQNDVNILVKQVSPHFTS